MLQDLQKTKTVTRFVKIDFRIGLFRDKNAPNVLQNMFPFIARPVKFESYIIQFTHGAHEKYCGVVL